MKNILLITLLIIQTLTCTSASAFWGNETYYQNSDVKENIESDKKYCSPKQSLKDKLKNAFIGQPTGFTPQIEPAPYSTSYGPSYMQGFYSGTRWNDHNTYNPTGITGLINRSF